VGRSTTNEVENYEIERINALVLKLSFIEPDRKRDVWSCMALKMLIYSRALMWCTGKLQEFSEYLSQK
jgi:hypothetical protein